MPARVRCLTHTLTLLLEEEIRDKACIDNVAEKCRRADELAKRDRSLRAAGLGAIQPLLRCVQRITQRATKFIRWLRNHLDSSRPNAEALARLTKIYATS
ncbi:hypothetical protein HNR46_003306 [Haloferula luteola]|uniref:Uncharacterized protein n=1 Tax=Haloferula luteola TaxID=595692 RepID=A0A840V5Y5_9BACT|nr:hypothetical protein [Haloferula luteola]MBB5353053.1 hypothetical protein [Haloferula luteola]